jgi:SAM-dependent methyltransferase
LVLQAYDALAPYYDRFTRTYEHGVWLRGLEQWAVLHGLQGRRLLDVACGTGKSFEPMLALGYTVTACDVSPEMVATARRRGADSARVVVADMRELRWRQEFDLVTCVNDAINYLVTKDDLAQALKGMARALVPGGLAIFDVNSLMTFRTAFAARTTDDDGEHVFEWEGSVSPDFQPGDVAEAELTVIHPGGTCRTRHVQRHWPIPILRRACHSAGFSRLIVRGQLSGARLVGTPREDRHPKFVCLAIRARGAKGTCQPARHLGNRDSAAARFGPRMPSRHARKETT